MYWIYCHRSCTNTRKFDSHSDIDSICYRYRDSKPDSRSPDEHSQQYAHGYIHADQHSNIHADIDGFPTCHVDGVSDADRIINSVPDSVTDAQFHIDAVVHAHCAFTYTIHHFFSVTNIDISIT